MSLENWPIKTISLKQCRRCKTTWSSEREKLEPGDQINIVPITIAYCPACADGFAEEIDRPTYERRTNKRIR